MFIAFEGPAFSGKTTQAKKLVDYINEHYKAKAFYVPFGTLAKDKMTIYKGCMDNASAYISTDIIDFYSTLYAREKIRENRKAIYVLDGYYYDTMITAKVMFEESKKNKNYKQFDFLEINDFVRMMAHRMALPVPDMLFLLIPDIDVLKSRIPEKVSEDDKFIYSRIYQEYLLSLQDCNIYRQRIPELINPIIIRDYSTASATSSLLESMLTNVKGNSRNVEEVHNIISNIFDKYANLVTNTVIDPNLDKNAVEMLRQIRSQFLQYREMLERVESDESVKDDQEISDDDIVKKYGFNETQLKIFKDMDMDPTKVIYHYSDFYNNSNYTPRQKFTIIETMIRMLTACIDNKYIYNISEAYNTISKLRVEIESLTDVGEVNINENTSSFKSNDVEQGRSTKR